MASSHVEKRAPCEVVAVDRLLEGRQSLLRKVLDRLLTDPPAPPARDLAQDGPERLPGSNQADGSRSRKREGSSC
jgi:hypothetical protein